MVNSKKVSIFFMMTMTIFLTFLDVKDLYYKITMCGPEPSWSFTADFYEAISDIELVSFLKENNGTWVSNANMWNALAMQCDSLQIFKITTMYASLSAIGRGCVLSGVKRMEPLVFVSSVRIDSFVWGAELLAGVIHQPFPVRAYTSSVYSLTYNLPETVYRANMATMIAPEDVSALNASTRLVFEQFGTQTDLWEDTLCYEILPLPEYGHSVQRAIPEEYGCIWSEPDGGKLHTVHVDKAASKYFHILSDWVGWGWITIDSLQVSTLYIRARLRSKPKYRITNTEQDGLTLSHFLELDMGLDGVLYFVMLLIEVLIILINSLDAWVVALLVVRPLVLALKRNSQYASRISSTADGKSGASNASAVSAMSGNSTNEATTGKGEKTVNKPKKDETLSKMLLYTDLSCVAFRKQLLALLLVIDAFFSWLYIVPNSTLYAWSTSTFQIGSAYLSNFRVWTVVLVFIDQAWRWTFVLANERLAALITEFTHITSFEIMLSTLLAVYLSYDDLLNVCIVKWGAVDSQRQLVMLTPAMGSFYNSFSMHTYGDRSNEGLGAHALYDSLFIIIRDGILFGFCIVAVRLCFNVGIKAGRGTLRREVESYWRNYQRNSVEVFMNDPLRAKALVRSQAMMSYRFGRSVFIRPFVYLEQNYYIYRGRLRRRPLFSIIDNSDSINGAEVNVSAYQLEGVYHDEETRKIRKKRLPTDTQIPLC